MKKKNTYEQPLNERIRSLLRLEYLFLGIDYRLKGPSTWDSRAVVEYLIEIFDSIERVDMKTDLRKDLEYYIYSLERWQNTPKGNTERINQLLDKAKALLERCEENDKPFGHELVQHPLINGVRQRITIAGGTCGCDLPSYHHWLQKTPKQRQLELNNWLATLAPLREAIDLSLYMIRNNAVTSQETAEAGFFQSTLDSNIAYQLVQVNLPLEHPCYPEISGGKQRVTIRFFEQNDIGERPLPTEQNIHFELCCCMM